jgi:lipid-A-disaccharide synthase
MADPARLFIVAGEPSGDRIGADLVKRLRVTRPIAISGVGGAELEGEGLRSLFPMSELSVMGVADVVRRLPLLLRRIRETADAILSAKPDVVVLIDAQEFSRQVATRVRKAGYTGRMMLYVAPSVWAWRPERAPVLATLFDEVLAVLPFEPEVMRRLGGPLTTYVGHPALSKGSMRPTQPESGPLLLLPGSRRGELRRHLPLLHRIAEAFEKHPNVTGFVLPTLRSVEPIVMEAVRGWRVPVYVTTSTADRHAAYAEAVAAVAVSGTVTLELALAGIPMVITYVGEPVQALYWRRYPGKYIGLPNILAGRELAPEVLQLTRNPAKLVLAVADLLADPEAQARQREGFAKVRALLSQGLPTAPLVDPAERVTAQLDQRLSIAT